MQDEPLFTRHTLGTIEAARDLRNAHHLVAGRRRHAAAAPLSAAERWPHLTDGASHDALSRVSAGGPV
jgi:hypothetical protein